MVLACLIALFAIGMLCLLSPAAMQRASIRWAELGMSPFPSFYRCPGYVWVLRLFGLALIGLTLFLLGGAARA